jgi:LAO/AO transport system kinase
MTFDLDSFTQEILDGSRSALARGITIIESSRSDHRISAEAVLSKLIHNTGRSIRIAISGPPGVGKSSFIEAFGLYLVSLGKKLAVLAIDPSSPVTGGSILGDKTRMEDLSKSENCFIRPSPASGALGGVAKHTRESMLLCEAAGFDVILIETVGIGQSEYMAGSMTDIFVQLHQPHSGDELQGIKKGVLELADLILVTKADGDLKTAAELAKKELERALSLIKANAEEKVDIITISSKNKDGIKQAWAKVSDMYRERTNNGRLTQKRRHQSREWLNQEITNCLTDTLTNHPKYENLLKKYSLQVETSSEHCAKAARDLVNHLIKTID